MSRCSVQTEALFPLLSAIDSLIVTVEYEAAALPTSTPSERPKHGSTADTASTQPEAGARGGDQMEPELPATNQDSMLGKVTLKHNPASGKFKAKELIKALKAMGSGSAADVEFANSTANKLSKKDGSAVISGPRSQVDGLFRALSKIPSLLVTVEYQADPGTKNKIATVPAAAASPEPEPTPRTGQPTVGHITLLHNAASGKFDSKGLTSALQKMGADKAWASSIVKKLGKKGTGSATISGSANDTKDLLASLASISSLTTKVRYEDEARIGTEAEGQAKVELEPHDDQTGSETESDAVTPPTEEGSLDPEGCWGTLTFRHNDKAGKFDGKKLRLAMLKMGSDKTFAASIARQLTKGRTATLSGPVAQTATLFKAMSQLPTLIVTVEYTGEGAETEAQGAEAHAAAGLAEQAAEDERAAAAETARAATLAGFSAMFPFIEDDELHGAFSALHGDVHLMEKFLRKKHGITHDRVAGSIDSFLAKVHEAEQAKIESLGVQAKANLNALNTAAGVGLSGAASAGQMLLSPRDLARAGGTLLHEMTKPKEKLSAEALEMKQLLQMFSEIDMDGSGSLEASEVKTLAARMGKKLTPAEVQRAMDTMDENGDGSVSIEEFQDWWRAAKSAPAFSTGRRGSVLLSVPGEISDEAASRKAARLKALDAMFGDAAPTEQGVDAYEKEREDEEAAILQEVEKLFHEIDTDGSGELERFEIGQLAVRMGKELTPDELDDAMDAMDEDASGSVSLEEFKQWWSNNAVARTRMFNGAMLMSAESVEGGSGEGPFSPRLAALESMFGGGPAQSPKAGADTVGEPVVVHWKTDDSLAALGSMFPHMEDDDLEVALKALKGDARLTERYLRKKHGIDQDTCPGTVDDYMSKIHALQDSESAGMASAKSALSMGMTMGGRAKSITAQSASIAARVAARPDQALAAGAGKLNAKLNELERLGDNDIRALAIKKIKAQRSRALGLLSRGKKSKATAFAVAAEDGTADVPEEVNLFALALSDYTFLPPSCLVRCCSTAHFNSMASLTDSLACLSLSTIGECGADRGPIQGGGRRW